MLEIEYSCVGNNVDDLDENTLNQLGAQRYKLNLDADEFKNLNETKNYDYLVLDRVLSKKKDPVEYLRRCGELLRDDGLIILMEITNEYEIALFIDGLQGRDLDTGDSRRIYGSYFSQDHLKDIIVEANYRVCLRQTDPVLNTTTYVIRKIPPIQREPAIIDIDDISQFTWIEPLQKVVEERLNEPEHKTVWIKSTRVRNNGTLGMALCFV